MEQQEKAYLAMLEEIADFALVCHDNLLAQIANNKIKQIKGHSNDKFRPMEQAGKN